MNETKARGWAILFLCVCSMGLGAWKEVYSMAQFLIVAFVAVHAIALVAD